MQNFRKQLDKIDQKIIKLLGERMAVSKEIGAFKKKAEMPLQDRKREEEIRDKLSKLAEKNGLSTEFVHRLYTHIFTESVNVQNQD